MSPSEHELRAALSDGEGPGLDVNAIVGNAIAYRRQRRARVLGGVSVAAIVAGIGVAGGFLISSSGNGSSASSADGAALNGTNSAATVPAAPSNGAGGGKNADGAVACPAALPSVKTPAPSAKNATGALFPSQVQSVVLCRYGTAANLGANVTYAANGGAELSGRQASDLVQSFETASSTPPGVCPHFRTQGQPQKFVVFGVNSAGTRTDPVVATVGDNPCQTVITNGTAVRYSWTPPNGLASLLAGLNSATSASPPVIGPSGTPIPSQPHS